jgi:diaminopimelate epimerase
MKFYKYHALGNDYIVLEPEDSRSISRKSIQNICNRNFGVGSDGILFGPLISKEANYKLRIYNPDGSEAEKSGNGIRIFSRHLWERKMVKQSFTLETKGGKVSVKILNKGDLITVQMGKVSFGDLEQEILIKQKKFLFTSANIGNPHCVILCSDVSSKLAKEFGPDIEKHKIFPKKTNVQFMKVLDRDNIQIEIWERGAGYTLASGSSSCASAAVAKKLGLCDSNITVHMPGGNLKIKVMDNFEVEMTGPVTKIAEGNISSEVLSQKTIPQ